MEQVEVLAWLTVLIHLSGLLNQLATTDSIPVFATALGVVHSTVGVVDQ